MKRIFKSAAPAFTRTTTTTAYTAGDLVANSTVAASVTPLVFTIPNSRGVCIRKATVQGSSTLNANATFKLHLYADTPAATTGVDNEAWLTPVAGYLGNISIDASTNTFSNGKLGVSAAGVTNAFEIYSDTDRVVYGMLTATAAYSPPASEEITVTIYGESFA